MATDITTIKNWFKTGLKPTQAQFWATWDSYWHKDESISISNIENLEKVLDNKADNTHEHSQYATNDATSLTNENILEWQKALKISDLKFDDKAITTTQDYSDFGLQAGATINSLNNAIYQTVRNKLDAPVEEGTTTDYPYVVGVNEDNESTKLPAGDLGKNFANTDLVVSSARKHTGTSTVEFGMPLVFSNAVQQFKNLADKSSDATFNALMGLDSNGNAGKLTALGNALESGLKNLSAEQGLRIGQLLNGGQGSSGSISISMISPPIVQKIDSNEYIVLRGANLNLNAADFSITILNSADKSIISKIPNSQIQMYSDGLSLVFYYNFKNFDFGTYLLRIQSGAKIYDTTLTLQVVENVNSVNVNELTWSKLYADGYTAPTSDVASGASLFSQTISTSNVSNILSSFKSSELFPQGQDFLIEMTVSTGMISSSQSPNTSSKNVVIGLGYSEQELSLVNQTLINYNIVGTGSSVISRYLNSTAIGSGITVPSQVIITIIKTGNYFRISIGNSIYSATFSNNSGYSIFVHNVGVLKGITTELNITKAFTFN